MKKSIKEALQPILGLMDTVPLVVVEVAVESGPKLKDVAISSMVEASGAVVIVAVSCPFISLYLQIKGLFPYF